MSCQTKATTTTYLFAALRRGGAGGGTDGRAVTLVGSALGLTFSLDLLGLGGGRGTGARLSFLLELVGVVEGSVLANGVVGLALSVNGLLNGLPEESRLLVGFFGSLRGSLTVQVTLNDGVLSGGVDGEERGHALLDILNPDGGALRNLDRLNDSVLEGDVHGGGEVLFDFTRKLFLLSLLNLILSPATGHLFVDLDSLELLSLEEKASKIIKILNFK